MFYRQAHICVYHSTMIIIIVLRWPIEIHFASLLINGDNKKTNCDYMWKCVGFFNLQCLFHHCAKCTQIYPKIIEKCFWLLPNEKHRAGWTQWTWNKNNDFFLVRLFVWRWCAQLSHCLYMRKVRYVIRNLMFLWLKSPWGFQSWLFGLLSCCISMILALQKKKQN